MASVMLAAAIGAGLAVVLVLWIDHSLADAENVARAALLAAPAGGWWQSILRSLRLAMLRRELRFTMDEIAWTSEDIYEVLPRDLERYKRHARHLQARIAKLEAQP
jgi:hypothetical protein